MMLALYLAKEVAAIRREILTHPTKKLYDDRTAHLLCSNYWVQPIFQELLHSSSRYNATRTGERNGPSSGLARISAHPRPPKKLKPSASGTRFTDWIGSICYADTLQVWFPAHWAPVVLRQLQHKEDAYRAAHPSWMDLEVALDDIKTQWQEANANRRMLFQVGDYKDSKIRMLTGTIKADWIQLPVERYLTTLPTLKQGVIAGVFKIKVPLPRPSLGPRSYSSRCSFPMTCHWMSGTQESTPCPLCGLTCLCWEPAICVGWSAMTFTTYGRSMMFQACGAISTHNGDYYSSIWKPKGLVGTRSQREERLFTNRSNRPGDDMKDELRTDGDPIAWRIWSTAQNQLWQLRQPAPPLEFPGEQGMFTDMYAQVREEEQVISLQFIGSQQDISKRRRKKRKQVDDGTAIV